MEEEIKLHQPEVSPDELPISSSEPSGWRRIKLINPKSLVFLTLSVLLLLTAALVFLFYQKRRYQSKSGGEYDSGSTVDVSRESSPSSEASSTPTPAVKQKKILKLEELTDTASWKIFTESEFAHFEFKYPPSWTQPNRAYQEAISEAGRIGDQGAVYSVTFPNMETEGGRFLFYVNGASEDFTASRGCNALESSLWGWETLETPEEKLNKACEIFNGRDCQIFAPRIYTLTATPNKNCGDGASYFEHVIFVEFPDDPINIIAFSIPMMSSPKRKSIDERFPAFEMCFRRVDISDAELEGMIDAVLEELRNPENNDEETNYYLTLFPQLLSTIKITQ